MRSRLRTYARTVTRAGINPSIFLNSTATVIRVVFTSLSSLSQGLDSHRHSAAHFEDIARRRGLQLICIDRPGRGRSDPIPAPEVDAEAGAEVDVQGLITEATEAAVVDTIKQASNVICGGRTGGGVRAFRLCKLRFSHG